MIPPVQFPKPSLAEWRATVAKELGNDLDALRWRADEDFAVDALSTREHLRDLSHLGTLPGCAPFVRGSEPLQPPFRSPLTVHEPSELASLPADLQLPLHTLHLGPSFGNVDALDQLYAFARARGADPQQLRATIALDPHQKLLRQHIAPEVLDARFASAAALLRHASLHSPVVRTFLVATRWFQHEGAGLVLETACALCSGIAAIKALERHGVAPDLAASHLAFRFAITSNIPLELARLRAARGLWAKIVRAFGIVHKSALPMHLEAETTPVTNTRREPHTNLIRSAVQAWIAALAGVETLSVLPFDARTQPDGGFSTRLGQNQQRILFHEAQLGRVADPVGGSYAIELLTDRVGRAVWTRLQQIESEGGLGPALARGTLRKILTEQKDARRARLRSGAEVLIGTNKFRAAEPAIARAPAPLTATLQPAPGTPSATAAATAAPSAIAAPSATASTAAAAVAAPAAQPPSESRLWHADDACESGAP